MSLSEYSETEIETLGRGAFAQVVGAGVDTVHKIYDTIDENVATEINTMLTIRKCRPEFHAITKTLGMDHMSNNKSCLMTLKSYEVDYTSNTATITLKKMDMTLNEFVDKYRKALHKKWDTIVSHIALKLGIALLEMKNAKIIHGDMKPDNVMLKFTDGLPTKKNTKWLSGMRLKIIDFNKSVMGDNVLKTTGIQTFYYAAPEIVLGNREYTYSVDMWAAGCIICELLLDRPLFNPTRCTTESTRCSGDTGNHTDSTSFSYSAEYLDNAFMLHLWNQVLGPMRNPVGRFSDRFFHRVSENSDECVLNGDVLSREGAGLAVIGVPPEWLPLMDRIFVYNDEDRIGIIGFIRWVSNKIE